MTMTSPFYLRAARSPGDRAGGRQERASEVPDRPAPSPSRALDGFRDVFDRYHRAVYRFFIRRGCSPDDAEELTQETFLGIYTGMESFRSEASFDTWVFRIAANVWRQSLRRRHAGKRRGRTISLSTAEAPDAAEVEALAAPDPASLDGALVRERVAALNGAVAELPQRMRQCVLLRLGQELSCSEIARILKISTQTVKVQLFRARRRLQDHQIEHFGDLDF